MIIDAIPDLIDNRDGNSLAKALNSLGDAPLSIATGFFTPSGLVQIAPAMKDAEKVRLLIGVEPPRTLETAAPIPGETKPGRTKRILNEEREFAEMALRDARDRYPFTPEAREALRDLAELAKQGKIEARFYSDRFLHAKAFIAGGEQPRVIAGSGNITAGGLSRNLELALGRTDDTATAAQSWFDELWDDAEDWDLAEYLSALIETYTPFEVYIRILLELYGDQLEELEGEIEGLDLTTFQRHGVAQALHIMRERGGAIIADEVGLGKTYIAGEIMSLYHSRRQRVLLVCPAALRDSSWKRFIAKHQFDLAPEVLSYEQLANEKQLGGEKAYLQRELGDYQLVVVDEAHNYRNPAAETRARVLHRLLQGKKRDVLLLTATPVNNSIWDLYHAIRMFVRQDAGLADAGVISLRDKFRGANALEPDELNPDMLFSVIDATTVKRTRQFVKKHYADDRIVIDGQPHAITFPKANALTVRYDVDHGMSALFDAVEMYLDPTLGSAIRFARYDTEDYRKTPDPDANVGMAIGLLRSGLLKRAESSVYAFGRTLQRMIKEHELFLSALDEGYVLGTRALRELSYGAEEGDLDTLLDGTVKEDARDFDQSKLHAEVSADLDKLKELFGLASDIRPEQDPKLEALHKAIKSIQEQAQADGVSEEDKRRNGKVLIFSYFSDTVTYVREALESMLTDEELKIYKDRVVSVMGGNEGDVSQVEAATGFAPKSSDSADPEDLYDILISTDVLAEGVNLQDCRNVINFDLPWNPMRLVQRHGRVDRIGSLHSELFLRSIFPADRLDSLLNIEQRILDKISIAARSIGVHAPVQQADSERHSFAKTRTEIEKLLSEDASLYERGGTAQSAQTAEQYRQTLRKALEENGEHLRSLPRSIGSGLVNGEDQGFVFCAAIGDETQLVFVPTTSDWRPLDKDPDLQLASCLRMIECSESSPIALPASAEKGVFGCWDTGRAKLVDSWNVLTDPRNVQPRVDRLNRLIAEDLRTRTDENGSGEIEKALRVIEGPWDQRDKRSLGDWYRDLKAGGMTLDLFVNNVLEAGVEPYEQPPLKPPIDSTSVELVGWLAVTPEYAVG